LSATSWYRVGANAGTWGPRALEEELQPTPLTPVPVQQATPLERQLAMALGLEAELHWPRLPLEVGSCEQGGRCCWRWLARAALERVAGVPMSHLGLADMVASLREELQGLKELRSWREQAEDQLEQAEKDKYELDKLRVAHEAAQQELRELRAKEKELVRVQAELAELHDANRQLQGREQCAQRELTALKAEKQVLVEGDLAAARIRAGQAERELTDMMKTKLDHKVLNEDLNRRLLREQKEVEKQKEENARLRREWEAAVKKKPRRRRRTTGSPVSGRGSPGRR